MKRFILSALVVLVIGAMVGSVKASDYGCSQAIQVQGFNQGYQQNVIATPVQAVVVPTQQYTVRMTVPVQRVYAQPVQVQRVQVQRVYAQPIQKIQRVQVQRVYAQPVQQFRVQKVQVQKVQQVQQVQKFQQFQQYPVQVQRVQVQKFRSAPAVNLQINTGSRFRSRSRARFSNGGQNVRIVQRGGGLLGLGILGRRSVTQINVR